MTVTRRDSLDRKRIQVYTRGKKSQWSGCDCAAQENTDASFRGRMCVWKEQPLSKGPGTDRVL